jgi:hypothetical protein
MILVAELFGHRAFDIDKAAASHTTLRQVEHRDLRNHLSLATAMNFQRLVLEVQFEDVEAELDRQTRGFII